MTYYVTYVVDGRWVAEVEAENLDAAMQAAADQWYDADFGELEDINRKPLIVEDERGDYVWEA